MLRYINSLWIQLAFTSQHVKSFEVNKLNPHSAELKLHSQRKGTHVKDF